MATAPNQGRFDLPAWQAASRLQIANYCLWGHVAEWLRNGLQNRPIRLLHQRPFRKIVEIPPQ
jgi:hypothetical protein